jgi:hypothetical protein
VSSHQDGCFAPPSPASSIVFESVFYRCFTNGFCVFIKDVIDNQPLTIRRLATECDGRRESISQLTAGPRGALCGFASLLRSPRIADRLRRVKDGSKALAEVLQATTDEELAETLLMTHVHDLKELAKLVAAVTGDRRPKGVGLSEFCPSPGVLWEPSDIDAVVEQLRDYLKGAWEDGCYLKLERGSR